MMGETAGDHPDRGARREVKPDVFAVVMATGIVSIAAADHGYRLLSDGLMVIAAAALPVLIVAVIRAWPRLDLGDPHTVSALFTYVAACAVVAARLSEHRVLPWVLAAMALQGWLSLAPAAVRTVRRHIGDLRARGSWELAAVATSGLAIVSASLQLLFCAALFWVLGIAVYLFMTGLIVVRVRRGAALNQLAHPDLWILMGGIAIATLAGDHLHAMLPAGPFADGVRAVTIATWVTATAWIVPLTVVAIRCRIALGWPAVFPLGMYSSATYAMSVETGWRWLADVSALFLWIALAAWVVVALASARRGTLSVG